MITPSEISAIVLTRGDVDLTPILDSLPYDEVIIYNGSEEEDDQIIYGRYVAIERAKHQVVYFQDDDILFTEHEKLCNVFDPHKITTNMPSPWYENNGYAAHKYCQVGGGSLMPRDLAWPAFDKYLAEYPRDNLFQTYADVINGVLTPYVRYDLGFHQFDYSRGPGRICTTPSSEVAKQRRDMIRDRALGIRNALVRNAST